MPPACLRAALATLLISSAALAGGQVWIVDDGPLAAPADFTTIQEAVDAAQDGDVVLVRPGAYDPFRITSKSLRVIGLEEGGLRPTLKVSLPPIEVFDLPAGGEVTLRGLDAGGITLINDAGDVWIEDVTCNWSVIAIECANVLLAHSKLTWLLPESSTLYGWDLEVSPPPNPFFAYGSNAIQLVDSTLFLSGSTVTGAEGYPGQSGRSPFDPACYDGGKGGSGLHLINSTCRALDCQFQGGSGGPPGVPYPGSGSPACSAGPSGLPVTGPGLIEMPGTAHDLKISSPGFEGEHVSLSLKGVAGEFVYALASPSTNPALFLPWNGALAVSPTSPLLFLGVLGPTGSLQASVLVGELGPGVDGVRLALQGIFVHPSAADYAGSPTDVELLERDLLLVDCNGNGVDDAADIALGTSLDLNLNGKPDECDVMLVVPDQYATIQAAVDAAQPKDIVLVRAGTYSGPGNADIRLTGRDLVIQGEGSPAATILDLSAASDYGFYLEGCAPTTRISGFTLRNSHAVYGPIAIAGSSGVVTSCIFSSNPGGGGWGGAITAHLFEDGQSVRIEDCRFLQNHNGPTGGALELTSSQGKAGKVVVTNCLFSDNTATKGGAIYCDNADLEVRNCAFRKNSAGTGSALMFVSNDEELHRTVSLSGCTFYGNLGTLDPAALWLDAEAGAHSADVRGCVLWNNGGGSPVQVHSEGDMQAEVAWSTLQNGSAGWSGPVTLGHGLLKLDPMFVSPPHNLHLAPGSPCIDAGDPAFVPLSGELDIDGQPRVSGPAVDQGADELQQ